MSPVIPPLKRPRAGDHFSSLVRPDERERGAKLSISPSPALRSIIQIRTDDTHPPCLAWPTVLVTGRLICHCQAPCCIKRRNSVLPGRADYKIMERAVASPDEPRLLKH